MIRTFCFRIWLVITFAVMAGREYFAQRREARGK